MAPGEYGVYLVVVGLADLIRPLSSLGVLPTLQQFLPEMAVHATSSQLKSFLAWSKVLRWVLLVGLVSILYAGWGLFSEFAAIPSGPGADPLIVCAMICVVLALEYSEATLEALLEQKNAQAVRLLHTGARLVGVVLLALLSSATASALLWLELVTAAAALVVSERLLRSRVQKLAPDGSKSFSRAELLRFGAHLTLSQVLSALSTTGTMRVIVSRMLGVEAAGQFGFMQMLLIQVGRLLPSLLLMNLVRPTLIVARVRGNLPLVAEACGLLYKSNVLLVWPIIPAMFLVGNELMYLLSGGRLQGAGFAMTCLFLALVGLTQIQVSSIVLQVHRMSGQLAWSSMLSLVAPVCVWLGAQHSMALACVGIAIATALRSVVTNWVIQRSSARVRFDWVGALRFVVAIGLAFGAGFLVSWLWSGPAAPWPALVAFVAVLVALLPACRPFAEFEARVLREVLGKRNAVFIDRFTHAS